MNKTSQTRRATAPRRPLRADFTTVAMRRAVTAQRRASQKQQLHNMTKELTHMKATRLLRTAPGAALGLAVVAAGSVGVYALTNWFGGNVNITQKDPSTFSIDLAACKNTELPGFEPTDDKHNMRFKILGSPHVSADQLQHDILGMCEGNAVRQFYTSKYPEANFNGARAIATVDPANQYLLIPATVGQLANDTITLHYNLGKGTATATQKTLPLTSDTSIYNAGQPGTAADVHVGDTVMAVMYSPGATTHTLEGTSILDNANLQIKSLFKTQYNDNADQTINYEQYNVMPLDMYNQTHKQ